MQNDTYAQSFSLLTTHLLDRTVQQTLIALGGINRNLPPLPHAKVEACHLKHYLSNDVDEQWVRSLHFALTCSDSPSILHSKMRTLVDDELQLTFANDEEIVLATQYGRERISAQMFVKNDVTKLFLNAQLSGYSPAEAQNFLINPLAGLSLPHSATVRLVSIETRHSPKTEFVARRFQQRWRTDDVTGAMKMMIANVSGEHWAIVQNLHESENGPTASLRHISSGDVIILDRVMGHGQLELRAQLQ